MRGLKAEAPTGEDEEQISPAANESQTIGVAKSTPASEHA